MKIGLVGAGHMGSAIIKGLHNANHLNMSDVFIKSGSSNKAKVLAESTSAQLVHHYNDLSKCETIILAVNKSAAENVLKEISKVITHETTLISIVASFPISEIEKNLDEKTPVVSLIPNTAVEVNQGVSGYSINRYVDEDSLHSIFNPLGRLIKVPEDQLSILSTVAGCGPAFLDLFIEGLSDGAVLHGMDRDLSYEVILEMIAGSAKLAAQSKKHPAQLKDEVTSPGGSTIKGVATLEKNRFKYALIEAVSSIEK
jgi:pyrroline-5-carboxylate reductase